MIHEERSGSGTHRQSGEALLDVFGSVDAEEDQIAVSAKLLERGSDSDLERVEFSS
jgi:hypothetical protein